MTFRKREPKPLFPLGQIAITPAALDVLAEAGVHFDELIARYVAGDWGDVSEEDATRNQDAIGCCWVIHSVYGTGSEEVWVITEADRSVTTVMLKDEY